ncbi:GTP-binding protein REM 1-like [Centruroides sculpturatus]|uniref:GTP-binding protein REM 1-like n=1 Tax=Centruroides sculpturatus TaxID=218467 RepID=UPI000C6CDEDC|nr:GTP-binding protein REM 1-like [Centruroides sculpturatus]
MSDREGSSASVSNSSFTSFSTHHVFRPRGLTLSSLVSKIRSEERVPSTSYDDRYLVRSFKVTSKGNIVNTGDSFRQKSRSNTNLASNGSCPIYHETKDGSALVRRVLMLGGVGVGKTALVAQFMSSDTANAYDGSQEEEVEKTVSVLLEGKEYELLFSDTPIPPDIPTEHALFQKTDAFVVVYSVTDRGSFNKASTILNVLQEKEVIENKAVILVGNKSDLERAREVPTEDAKSIASSYDCKFIEVSAGFNHNVDELLAGIVNQIRLKDKKDKLRTSSPKPSGFLNWLLGKPETQIKSKSCENLMVL